MCSWDPDYLYVQFSVLQVLYKAMKSHLATEIQVLSVSQKIKMLSCTLMQPTHTNVGSSSMTENVNSYVVLAQLFPYKLVFSFIPFTSVFPASERSTLIFLTW